MNGDDYVKQEIAKGGLLSWFQANQTDEVFDGICDVVSRAFSDGKFHELDKHLAEERERFAREKRHMFNRLNLGAR